MVRCGVGLLQYELRNLDNIIHETVFELDLRSSWVLTTIDVEWVPNRKEVQIT